MPDSWNARQRRRALFRPFVMLALCCGAAHGGLVNLEFRPSSQSSYIGNVINIDLYAVSADGNNQAAGLVGAVFAWDPTRLMLLGHVDNGPFPWALSGFPSDPSGVNADLTDGNAYYRAVVEFGGSTATATPAGLLVTTLQFVALSAATGDAFVGLLNCIDVTCSLVLDRHPLSPGVLTITGLLGPPVTVQVRCQASADCDDGNPCTDDSCGGGELCVNTPNDANDPDDGLFCNGLEIACSGGETIIQEGSVPDCDDGIPCTVDTCDEGTASCENTIDADWCLIDDFCHPHGTIDPENECAACDANADPEAWSFRTPGSACGSDVTTECDLPDSCDGAGNCLNNFVTAGSPCGSPASTTCTMPDTCDGSGVCLANHAPNGTPCDDGLFCSLSEACSNGVCTETEPRCPTGQVCDEINNLCKAVNLEWRSVQPSPVAVGEVVEVGFYAWSATGVNQSVGAISAILTWNPSRLKLLGKIDNGPYSWQSSSFPNDSALDGLNNTFLNGNALYQALSRSSPNPPAVATPAGLLVTTFRFEALAAGTTQLNLATSFGSHTETKVLDVNPTGFIITGTLGPAASINVVNCLLDEHCDDGVFCTGEETCVGQQCVAGTPPDCDDGVFCNGAEYCDASLGCVSPGNPCPNPDTCDEGSESCGGCFAPGVTAVGSRYLAITATGSGDPVALLVTGGADEPTVDCVAKWVQADGSLGDDPVYQTPAAWGTIYLTDLRIRPNTRYAVQSDCSPTLPGLFSHKAVVKTWLWGDVTGDGSLGIDDLVAVFDAANGNYGGGVLEQYDLAPCIPDGVVDGLDTAAVQSAFGAGSFPCPPPCAPAGPADNCPFQAAITEGVFAFDTTLATTDGPAEPSACNFNGSDQVSSDLWYCYEPSCTGTATVSLCGSSYDTRLAVYGGCDCPTSASATGCNDNACGQQSELSFPVASCGSYLLRVGGHQGATGPGTMTITCTPGPPIIDCNENGEEDACDIAAGTSLDLNGNGVPDECDPPIPTVSEWGLAALAVLLLIAATIVLRRRAMEAGSG